MIIPERILHVFQWPARHQIRLALPALLVFSLMFHVAGLYLVRATLPARGVSMPPPSVTVSLQPAGADSILLGARDPSWLKPGRFRDDMLAPPRAVRLHKALEPGLPELLPLPAPAVPARWVPALPPLAVRPWLVPPGEKNPLPRLQPVTARFEDGGLGVTDDLLGRLRAVTPPEPPGAPTELLVVLDAAGEVHDVWLVRGCGVPELDLAAQLAVQRSRFDPPGRDRQGILRVVWGTREVSS